jgi:hypothetical protein
MCYNAFSNTVKESNANMSPFTCCASRLLFLAILLMAPAAARPMPTVAAGQLPLAFTPYAGRADSAVTFQARGLGGTLFFSPTVVMLALPAPAPRPRLLPLEAPRDFRQELTQPLQGVFAPQPATPSVRSAPPTVLSWQFVDANPTPELRGLDKLPRVTNYFIGNDPTRWRAVCPPTAAWSIGSSTTGLTCVMTARVNA